MTSRVRTAAAVLSAATIMASSIGEVAVISDPLAEERPTAEHAAPGSRRLRRTSSATALSPASYEGIVGTGDKDGSDNKKEGKDVMVDMLSNLVFSGTKLDEGERNLVRGDPTLADLQDALEAKGEISDYYWRQLRYAHSNSMPYMDEAHPKPASAPASKSKTDFPSELTCANAFDDCDNGGTTGHSGDGYEVRTIVVEFHYNVECKGYVGSDDYDALDYALLKEAAEDVCDGDYEWEDRRRNLASASDRIETNDANGYLFNAGPNSVLDILRDEDVGATEEDGLRRKLEIVSIDADPEDERAGPPCTPHNPDAKPNCCKQRTGYVTVKYNECGDDNTNDKDVTAAVLTNIKETMDKTGEGNGVDDIFDHGDYDGEDSNIVEVVYKGPDPDHQDDLPIMSLQQAMNDPEEGLTSAQKAGIAAAALLAALLALLALLAARRRRNAGRDDKSIDTDVLDGSYCTADYGNLGGRHSKLDVHRCKSSLCKGCTSGRPDLCNNSLPVVEEESDQIVRDLAAIQDRDVVFLRTQGTAQGQVAEHVNIDLGLPDGPMYTEQTEIAASLDGNRDGEKTKARII